MALDNEKSLKKRGGAMSERLEMPPGSFEDGGRCKEVRMPPKLERKRKQSLGNSLGKDVSCQHPGYSHWTFCSLLLKSALFVLL